MKRALATLILASLLMTALPLNVSAAETDDIPTNVAATGEHDSLVAALTQADLVTTLQGDGPFTVFAPTDAAFEAAGIDLSTFDTDEENATLADILLYHVYSGAVASSDVTDGMTVTMVNGADATFAVLTDGTVKIGEAVVTTADVQSSNGVIHVIDTVLMPPPAGPGDIPTIATSTGVHTALVAALAQADLVTTLQGDGPFTVFAPTDAAFAAAGIDLATFDTDEENTTLVDILLYHVAPGAVASSAVTDGLTVTMVNGANATFAVLADGTVMIGDANVTTADVQASNGIIHVIDTVLMPPVVLSDIPTVATSTGVHTSLVAALAQAELVATLQGDGPFTVFAPTDAAFTAAGIDLAAFDTTEEIAALADILLYHVVPGTTLSTDLVEGVTTVTTANGDELSIQVTGTSVMVGESMANVTLADVLASNGVVHVIDQVLLPPADEPQLPDCDATVGIAPSGLKFSPATVTIAIGDTVCWQWTDSSMAHNVREVDGDKSTTYTQDGITSGAADATVDFRYTFTEDTTFTYACEPHMATGMYGKVIVGTGGESAVIVEPAPMDMDESEDTPGFMASTLVLAFIGAVLIMQRRPEQ